MSFVSSLSTTVLDVSSCVCFSSAATFFYKKTFDVQAAPIVASLFVLAIVLQNMGSVLTLMSTPMLILFILYQYIKNKAWINSAAKLDVFLPFLVVVLDIKFDLLSYIGLDIAYSNNWKIIMVAIPQFIRKPVWLKAKLQGLRSRLGPIYVFYVTSYVTAITATDGVFLWTPILAGATVLGGAVATIVYTADNLTLHDRSQRGNVVILVFAALASILEPDEAATWASPLLAQISIAMVGKFAMFASILAGIVLFRPDNSTMLDIIGEGLQCLLVCLPGNVRPQINPYRTTLAERRYYHGRLMVCSLICCVILTLAEHCSGKYHMLNF